MPSPEYEGSVAIDSRLLDAADIREYERVEVYNLENGERFDLRHPRRCRHRHRLGQRRRRAQGRSGRYRHHLRLRRVRGTRAGEFQPRLVYVDANNRITHTRNAIPVQVA